MLSVVPQHNQWPEQGGKERERELNDCCIWGWQQETLEALLLYHHHHHQQQQATKQTGRTSHDSHWTSYDGSTFASSTLHLNTPAASVYTCDTHKKYFLKAA